jgi:hypothetical protein
LTDRADDRHDPAQLFFFGDGLGAGPARLPADIYNICALADEPAGVPQRALQMKELPAIEERIRGHVQDSHHQGAPSHP